VGKANRKLYDFAVAWIALNDDEIETDPVTISEQLTVVLVSDMFDVRAEKVAQDVLEIRNRI
jgi:hypothetical protein